MISLLRQYGLHAGPRRTMSFFSMTAVTRGYTRELRPFLGFSYEVMGAMVEGSQTLSIVNDAAVASKVHFFLQQHPSRLDQEIFPTTEDYLKRYNTPSSLQEQALLCNILLWYPKYCGVIGIYNALNRYVNAMPNHRLTTEQLQKIGFFRNALGGMYPIIDAQIMQQLEKFPQGKLLGYLTFAEMALFLADGTIPEDLAERSKECIYLYLEKEDKEIIITDPILATQCKAILYPSFDKNATELKGQPIYPGKVRGTAAIVPRCTELPSDAIIVTSMTTVNEIPLLAKALAVVADEGGILWHAAVIARELRKPCIVGTKVGSRIFKEGDLIEVDADKGIVRKLSP